MITVLSPDEGPRLVALARYGILDTSEEGAFDAVATLAARLLNAPVAQVAFVDLQRRWSKASVGAHPQEIPREQSLCAHAILGSGPLIVPDACGDARFEGNPLLSGSHPVRFYAAAPLRTPDGFNIGTLFVADHRPRELDASERARIAKTLSDLATLAMEHLEARRVANEAVAEAAWRRGREEALQDEQARRTRAFGVERECFFTLDSKGVVREWERSATEMFGRSAAEAVGRPLVDVVVPEYWHRRYTRALEMCIEGAQTQSSHVEVAPDASPAQAQIQLQRDANLRAASGHRMQMLARHPDGGAHDGEFYCELGLARLDATDGNGEPLYRAYVRDINKVEREREWLRQLEMVVTSANDAILITEAEPQNHPGPRILYCNEAFTRMTGFTQDEVYGKTPRMLHGKDTDEVPRKKIRDALKKWKPVVVEMINYRKDGTPFWVELSIVPVKDETGWWTHWISVQRDISERKRVEETLQRARDEAEVARAQAETARAQAEAARDDVEQQRAQAEAARGQAESARVQAERANAAKSEFLSRMSHELRTPLNAILGFAQLMQMEQLEEHHSESVEHIVKAGGHLLTLINEVLDIARIESGRLALSPEPVQMSDALGEVVSLLKPLAARANVQLFAPPPDAELFVLADRQRLKQVLLNLLSNAVKYNRMFGEVNVECRVEEGRAQIRVSDTGIGISPEHLSSLFTPFERLGAKKTGVEGTGLGLALSKRLIETMGGTMHVESRVGEGSTFIAELPLSENPLRALQETLDAQAAPSDASRKVLYIEDNLSNFTLIERILSGRASIELVPAMQGGLGLDLAREHKPDLILLDLHLPDMDGEEVLRRLRADEITRRIPVAIISADATPGRLERLKALNVNAYLTKPIDVRRFLELIDGVLVKGEVPDFARELVAA